MALPAVDAGVKQTKLADAPGISRETVRQWLMVARARGRPMTPTSDVCPLVPPDVAEAFGLVPDAQGQCLSWWLLDPDGEPTAVESARDVAAAEIGGEPGQYSLVRAEPVAGLPPTE